MLASIWAGDRRKSGLAYLSSFQKENRHGPYLFETITFKDVATFALHWPLVLSHSVSFHQFIQTGKKMGFFSWSFTKDIFSLFWKNEKRLLFSIDGLKFMGVTFGIAVVGNWAELFVRNSVASLLLSSTYLGELEEKKQRSLGFLDALIPTTQQSAQQSVLYGAYFGLKPHFPLPPTPKNVFVSVIAGLVGFSVAFPLKRMVFEMIAQFSKGENIFDISSSSFLLPSKKDYLIVSGFYLGAILLQQIQQRSIWSSFSSYDNISKGLEPGPRPLWGLNDHLCEALDLLFLSLLRSFYFTSMLQMSPLGLKDSFIMTQMTTPTPLLFA